MSQQHEISKKIEDLLFESNVNVSTQQDPTNTNQQQQQQNNNNKFLSLENGYMNSLALMPHHSIQRGIPLSRNMLSQDFYYKQPNQQQQYEDNQQNVSQNQQKQYNKQTHPQSLSQFQKYQYKPHHLLGDENNNDMVILQDQDQWLVDQLSLQPSNTRRKKAPENTKNVLRNFGNAQNQYALYNQDAINLVKKELTQPEKFYQWVRTLKLQNFDQFKAVWGEPTHKHQKLFRRVYKKVCWKFYTEAAIPYVLTSRMRDAKTKVSHLKYVYRFLQGLKNPEDFSYFKKVEK